MMSEAPERIWGEVFRRDEGGHTLTIAGDYPLHKEDSVEYIRADLARPKVKPLEWVTLPWSTESVFYCYAESLFGDFGYGLDNECAAYYAVPDQEGFIEAESPEAAKAAAQEEYERRILAALETPE